MLTKHKNNSSITNKYIFLIILIGFIARLLWVFSFNVVPVSDFETYHKLASEICEGRIIYNNYISVFPHVIGYPLVLSVFYKIFGAKVLVAQSLNILLSLGIILLLFLIGKTILNTKCGLIASIIWALWPSQIFYTSLVCTEIIYTFLVLLFCLLFIVVLKKSDGRPYTFIMFFSLGLLCSMLNSVRPFGILLLTAVGIYYLFMHAGETRKYIRVCNYLVLVVVFIITTKAVNYNISNLIGKEVSQSPGYTLFVGSNFKYGGTWNKEDAMMLGKLMEIPNFDAKEVHNTLFQMAIERVFEQKGDNVLLVFKKVTNNWFCDSDVLWYIKNAILQDSDSYLSYSKYYVFFVIISNIYYYVFIIIFLKVIIQSIWQSIRYKRLYNNYVAFFILFVLGVGGMHIFVEAAIRYHFVAIPVISIVVSYSLVNKGKMFL